jgi:uncharacterized protein with HEPN domain
VKDDRFYVEHILECIEKIERFSSEGESQFFKSDLIQDAILRNLQILSESTKRLTEELKSRHTAVDWRSLTGFRNVLVHEYLGINVERV